MKKSLDLWVVSCDQEQEASGGQMCTVLKCLLNQCCKAWGFGVKKYIWALLAFSGRLAIWQPMIDTNIQISCTTPTETIFGGEIRQVLKI